ncbi:unnamed protein product, partial [Didymodactylos carnosus]
KMKLKEAERQQEASSTPIQLTDDILLGPYSHNEIISEQQSKARRRRLAEEIKNRTCKPVIRRSAAYLKNENTPQIPATIVFDVEGRAIQVRTTAIIDTGATTSILPKSLLFQPRKCV